MFNSLEVRSQQRASIRERRAYLQECLSPSGKLIIVYVSMGAKGFNFSDRNGNFIVQCRPFQPLESQFLWSGESIQGCGTSINSWELWSQFFPRSWELYSTGAGKPIASTAGQGYSLQGSRVVSQAKSASQRTCQATQVNTEATLNSVMLLRFMLNVQVPSRWPSTILRGSETSIHTEAGQVSVPPNASLKVL